MSNKTTIWETTAVQSLLRNRSSGKYYGRWKVSGKQKWVNLRTDVFTVAKLRILDETKAINRLRAGRDSLNGGLCTMADLISTYRDRTEANVELKPSSKASRLVALRKIEKTWPRFASREPAEITAANVTDWAAKFKQDGTNYTAPGTQTARRGNSATSVNQAIDTLRRLLDIAIERGVIHANPVNAPQASGRLKKKITRTRINLPSMDDVRRIFTAVETNGARGGWGIEAADFCRFLAFSGCRVGEVKTVTWKSVDWEKKQLRVMGYKSETSDRIVPLFAGLEALLLSVKERRKSAARFAVDGIAFVAPDDPLFRLNECQKSIDKACVMLGLERITHHDFRHLFATRCIEKGVDIPTVSRWLGHSDGGALAMKTYGHLRQEHSQAQAAKVDF